MINSNINSSSITTNNDSGPQLNSAANNSINMGRQGNSTRCRNTDNNNNNIPRNNNINRSSSSRIHPEDQVRAVTGAGAGMGGRG